MPLSLRVPSGVPDYSKPVERTYIDMANILVNHYEPWGVLCLAGRPSQALELPPWCPDWSIMPTKPARIGLMHLEGIGFHKKLEEGITEADSRLQNEEEKPYCHAE